jgi:hypothetical protein
MQERENESKNATGRIVKGLSIERKIKNYEIKTLG